MHGVLAGVGACGHHSRPFFPSSTYHSSFSMGLWWLRLVWPTTGALDAVPLVGISIKRYVDGN
jgi:hypothetical protein